MRSDILELVQRVTIAGKLAEDNVAVLKSLFGRALKLAMGDAFSEAWYLDTYPDVKKAVKDRTVSSGLAHYIESGIYEGRYPFPVDIDEDHYLDAHPDVSEAIDGGFFPSAQAHFLEVGYAEGRFFKCRSDETAPK